MNDNITIISEILKALFPNKMIEINYVNAFFTDGDKDRAWEILINGKFYMTYDTFNEMKQDVFDMACKEANRIKVEREKLDSWKKTFDAGLLKMVEDIWKK